MKITLMTICLLLLVPCQAAPSSSAQEVDETGQYILRLHRQIENYYNDQLSDLNQRAQLEISLLEIAGAACPVASLAAQAQVAKETLRINHYGYQEPWYAAFKDKARFVYDPVGSFRDVITKSPEQFVAAQNQVADRKSRILAQLEWETLNLQRLKEYALTVGLAQLEKQLRENAQKPQPAETNGMVTGILYSDDKPAAIVGREIVHNGESINGVTVVRIDKDRVTFEKNGKTWEQKVRQKPQGYWK